MAGKAGKDKPAADDKKGRDSPPPPPEPQEIVYPESLEEQLAELKKLLEEKKKDVALKEEEKNEIVDAIVTLKKAIIEINKVADSFRDAFLALKKGKQDMRYYYRKKRTMIGAAVKSKLPEIEAEMKIVDQAVKQGQKERNKLDKSYREAQALYLEAQEHRDTLQADYDFTLALQQHMENKLKELADVKKAIEEEEEQSHFANMHFLIDNQRKEQGMGSKIWELIALFRKLRGRLPIRTPMPGDDSPPGESPGTKVDPVAERARKRIKLTLVEKWLDLAAAEKDMLRKERQAREIKEKLEASEKELAELLKNRRDNILTKLSEIKF